MPEPIPIVPTESMLLLQVPPPGVLLRVVVLPSHTLSPGAPVIGVGSGFTVNIAVAVHPVPTE